MTSVAVSHALELARGQMLVFSRLLAEAKAKADNLEAHPQDMLSFNRSLVVYSQQLRAWELALEPDLEYGQAAAATLAGIDLSLAGSPPFVGVDPFALTSLMLVLPTVGAVRLPGVSLLSDGRTVVVSPLRVDIPDILQYLSSGSLLKVSIPPPGVSGLGLIPYARLRKGGASFRQAVDAVTMALSEDLGDALSEELDSPPPHRIAPPPGDAVKQGPVWRQNC